ncbi:MAG: hypothetical protein D6705_12795 [Deltaproteobacteria bacterium]|nr:MAG: hypothetical protein D6705_12795 [Deltaproteobacteria bacterium]
MTDPTDSETSPEPPRAALLRRLVGIGVIAGSVAVAYRLASPDDPAEGDAPAAAPGEQAATRPLGPRKAAVRAPATAAAPREAGDGAPAAAPEELDLDTPPESEPPGLAESERLEWYVGRLATARRDLAAQRRARARMPELREKAEASANPEVALREWEAALERLEENIARSEEKIRWYEAKLRSLGVDPAEP